jgi:hypothetical protein
MQKFTKHFEGIQDLLNFLETTDNPLTNKTDCMSIKRGMKDWSGTNSFEDAKELAIKGWEEGTKAIEKFTSMFLNQLVNSLKIDDYFYDVTGQDFDLDRVLIGEPESWLQSEQMEVKAPAQHNVKILVHIGAMAFVSKETIRRKGAAVAALVMLLEKARRGVELVVVSAASTDFEFVDYRVTIKQAGEDLDLAKLAFVLTHVAFFRRLMFGIYERIKGYWGGGYGRTEEVEKGDSDLYVGYMEAHKFTDDKGAEAWILGELKKQGVELKGDL